MDIYQTLLNNSMVSMQNMQDMMETVTIAKMEQICGVVGNFDSIGLYFGALSDNFAKLNSTASQFSDIMSCETINSIYTDAVHDQACTEIPRALLWTFVSLLIVSVFGMIMITLRSAWLEVRGKRTRLMDDLPVISIEKIQDLDDEHFNDSPSPKYSNNHRRELDEYEEEDSSPLTDPSPLNDETTSSNIDHDPVARYHSTSVADEILQDIPTSPKDPPNYRVY